jgi:uncharacterized protein YjbI with pentapeptide repeats
MTPQDLARVLEEHKLWLSSGGKIGKRINGGDDFSGNDLSRADLRRAKFGDTLLRGTNLREADLQNADLENAKFLLTSQLAGADVAGAKLPSAIAEFKGLENITEATSNAQKLFIAMLTGCLYSWLTIGTTRDSALLTNSATSPLPVIGTAIPIASFYLLAPIVLIAVYFYFHLNMQRLWEALAELPAIFPDGRPLDKMADPWLLNGLVRAHFARLRSERPPLFRTQQYLSILLAWWVVPLTLLVFWGHFLRRHDWIGSGLHIAFLAATIGFGLVSFALARLTLRGLSRKQLHWRDIPRDSRLHKRIAGFAGVCVIAAILYFCTHQAIDTFTNDFDYSQPPKRIVPEILKRVGFRPFVDVREEDVSTKLQGWSPVHSRKIEEVAFVKGARLRNANMKSAYAPEAFLVNADLNGADLRNAILTEANLAHADLRNANLSLASLVEADVMETKFYGADLTEANLMGVDLSRADLTEALLIRAVLYNAVLKAAKLTHADLVGAKLSGADMEDADLSRAELTDASFDNVNLRHTNLKGVDLRSVSGLTRHQLVEALTDEGTRLPADLPP